jgi:hypothetical protein
MRYINNVHIQLLATIKNGNQKTTFRIISIKR